MSLKRNIRLAFASLAVMFSLSLALAPLQPVGAIGIGDGVDSAKGESSADCLFGNGNERGKCTGGTPIFQTITNVLLFIIGAISVIMLIIGGIRYTVSGGDSTAVSNAKNTILYAIVGIIVAILAYAVVNFVVGSFTGGGAA